MAPTKRLDEAGDPDGVASAHPERWTIRSDSRPRVVDDALRSASTAPEREGTRYLGPPKSDCSGPCTQSRGPRECFARLAPHRKLGPSAALSDLGYEYETAMTGNPLISWKRRVAARRFTFLTVAWSLLLFRRVSGWYGSKMGAVFSRTPDFDERAASTRVAFPNGNPRRDSWCLSAGRARASRSVIPASRYPSPARTRSTFRSSET
jgi:hypothetical protein